MTITSAIYMDNGTVLATNNGVQGPTTASDPDVVAWVSEGNIITPYLPPIINSTYPATIPNLIAYAANKRYSLETGGMTINGVTVDTSRDSQTMINGAYIYMTTSGATTISYKANSGWITIDAATVKAIALAIGQHVQTCFNSEKAIDDAINAGTITTFAEIDSYNWGV